MLVGNMTSSMAEYKVRATEEGGSERAQIEVVVEAGSKDEAKERVQPGFDASKEAVRQSSEERE